MKVRFLSTVEKQNGVYYWIYDVTTCDCDRMYCKGCKTVTRQREIEENPFDCPKCHAQQSVIPTYVSIPELRLKRIYEGETKREGHCMKCSICGYVDCSKD